MIYLRIFISSFIILTQIFEATLYGTYNIKVKSFESEIKDGIIDTKKMKFIKLAKNVFVVNGTFKVNEEIPEDLAFAVKTARRYGSGYVDYPAASMSGHACTAYHTDKFVVPFFLNHSNGPREKCPWPPGSYDVYNLTVNREALPQSIPYGDWKITILCTLVDKIILKFILYAIISPLTTDIVYV
ncbi:uncharacterized protein LOC123294242 [Chrysoperla carnea]|uniref:uncharacterized protein LOC123294242 n=1 Tax=Chrysoperla carnea TaxID=189513 RepID=UPI001D07379D|nr:uncharacterized protein LOC123294242 [Chrysoperla carnea]